MQSQLYQAGWKLIDVLFPPCCAGCGSWGKRYCLECMEHTQQIVDPICRRCGIPTQKPPDVLCDRCQTQQAAFTAIRSWAVFAEPLQTAIHKLKYYQDRGLGEVLAKPLSILLQDHVKKADLLTPVPLDRKRMRERGYNQSSLLAKPVSWQVGIPYTDHAISRIKITRQQVGLSLEERKANMAGAFSANKEMVMGKTIVVIDDVVTTGATINACAQALIDGGANQVFGLTLARALAA